MMESKHPIESNRRLILILDEVGEADDSELKKLLDIIGRTNDKRSHKVQFIVTCDLEHKDELAPFMKKGIVLNKDRIAGDMRHFAKAQVKSLTRLVKLRPGFRRLLVRKIIASADCENLYSQKPFHGYKPVN
jgi:hypothetical protein